MLIPDTHIHNPLPPRSRSLTTQEETFFTRNGATDMFWPFTMNQSTVAQHCADKWGVAPRFQWIAQAYGVGGAHGRLLGGSNIVRGDAVWPMSATGEASAALIMSPSACIKQAFISHRTPVSVQRSTQFPSSFRSALTHAPPIPPLPPPLRRCSPTARTTPGARVAW